MKGLILAAGKGQRLEPLTKIIPKALLPMGKRPLITYPLLKFKKAGIKDIGIVVRGQNYSQFKSTLKFKGVKITYIIQKRPRGTLKAIQAACDFIGKKRFLLCWCDFLSPFDFGKLIKEHLKFKPTATILVNREKDPCGTAQVLFKGPYITKIVEKPTKRLSFWGSTGLLALEPQVFDVFPKIKPMAKGEYHIASALQYLINEKKRVRFVKIDTWRINVNTFEDLTRALTKFLKSLDSWE